jgi:hypothetical protein
MVENKAKNILVIIAKIFFLGLILQFFLQTFVTFSLGFEGTIWSVIWMWKEIIVMGIL